MTPPPSPPAKRAVEPDLDDIHRRAAAVVAQRWAGASLGALERFTSGTSSLTFGAPVDGAPVDRVVVKVAPPGLEPVRNRDVLRQARLLSALHEAVPEVPSVHGTDGGDPPATPPLFVMEHVDGEDVEPRHHPGAHDPTVMGQRAAGAMALLARLHRCPPEALGLTDEPVLGLEAEVARWRQALASCQLPPSTAATADAVVAGLVASVPPHAGPVVQHGDWRLGNMLCAGTEVRAVIDWEIWAVGDPRLDLAWFLLMADPDHPSALQRGSLLPPAEVLVDAYSREAGAAVSHLGWFAALVRYKQAAASALLVKNAARRGETGAQWNRMNDGIESLLRSAAASLASEL